MSFKPTEPGIIRVGSFGDSTANIEATQGTTDITAVTVNGYAAAPNKMAAHIGILSNGIIQYVANGGVSGDTTTGALNRDAAAVSATRKSITDLQLIGCHIVTVCLGINDLRNNINSGTSSGSANATVATALTNIQTVMQRIYALGMWPMYVSIAGQTYGSQAITDGKSSADITAINTYALSLNSQVQSWINNTAGYGTYIDTSSTLANQSTFNYNTGNSNDGLHLSIVGSLLAAPIVMKAILGFMGLPTTGYDYRKLQFRSNLYSPTNSQKNIWQNPLFVNSASGLATGISGTPVGIGVGSANITAKSIGALNNMPIQYVTLTPATFDGTNTLSISGISLDVPVYGASPKVFVDTGDIIIASADVIIDNGSGAAATAISSFACRLSLSGTAALRGDNPTYDFTSNHENLNQVISGRFTAPPIQINDKSVNLTTMSFQILVSIYNNTTPYRIGIQNIQIVKIPADKSDLLNNGIPEGQIAVTADANFTNTIPGASHKITATITAGRTFTLPTASTAKGKRIKIWNLNATAFNWSFTGATAKDKTNATITTLSNNVWYILESDGTNWNQIN